MILPTTDRAAPTSAPVWPAPAEAAELFQRGELVPVYSTQLADLETPVSVYLKLRQLGGASFLLESVEGEEQIGRYSFIGANPAGSRAFAAAAPAQVLSSQCFESLYHEIFNEAEPGRSQVLAALRAWLDARFAA